MKAGWAVKQLSEIAEYFIGLTYSPKDVSTTGIVVLRSSNIQNDEIDLSDLVRVSRSVKDALKVRDGDILMCSRNGSKRLVGKTAVISNLPEEMTFGTFMTVIRSERNPYLAWFFKSDAFREQLGVGENTMINQVTKYMLDAIRVSLPPLQEQQRIVGILDAAFDGIAVARASAEQNLQNARALFESHLQSVFTQRGEGWVDKTIDEVCLIGDGNHSSNYPRKEELVEVGVPFIRSTNLVDGRIDDTDMRFLSPEKHARLKKGHLKSGDILITNRGEIGKTAIVDAAFDNANLNSQIAWLRCREELNNKFLFHALNSEAIQKYFQSAKSGAALQQFTIKQLKELRIPLPPKKQQQSIVENLDSLREETQRLASLYQRKLAALDELKKSLLHQAFSGML